LRSSFDAGVRGGGADRSCGAAPVRGTGDRGDRLLGEHADETFFSDRELMTFNLHVRMVQ